MSSSPYRTLDSSRQFRSTVTQALVNGPTRTREPRKSSGQVFINIPVVIRAADLNGREFSERANTEHISRHGASLVLKKLLGPDQQVTLRRTGAGVETTARVVGQIGIRPEGHVYGVVLEDSRFWGVNFPPVAYSDAGVELRCTCCVTRERVALNEIEAAVLAANKILSRPCTECRATTFWQAFAQNSQATCPSRGGEPVAAPSPKTNRRNHLRTSMRASACLCQPSGLRDVSRVLDVSRGGISFQTTESYSVHSWVEVAAPYIEGGANIFVPGRIAWERRLNDDLREYGVQYVRN
jgi:PilZ domain-containing protein